MAEGTQDFLHNVYGTRSHSGWLAFMYPRLKVARDLLTEDGVIFVSIDENEHANLKIICDEIFGEQNLVADLVWANKKGSGYFKHFNLKHENILCYSKNKEITEIKGLSISNTEKENYNLSDEYEKTRGKYLKVSLEKAISYSASLDYGIEAPDGTLIYPNKGKEKVKRWGWSKEKVKWGIENGFIVIKKQKEEWKVYKKQYLNSDNEGNIISIKIQPHALIEEFSTTVATKKLKQMFDGTNVFDFSKPVGLMKRLINISTEKDDTILDFFGGSGTTAHSVLDLNAEDNGNRKFIIVQWDEAINPKKSPIPYNFCLENNFEPVISSITIERINRAGETIKQGNLLLKDLDIGYKVFSLVNKPDFSEDENGQMKMIHTRKNVIDTLYNMMILTGKTLDKLIEPVIENILYKVEEHYYLIGNISTEELSKYQDCIINIDAYSSLSLENYQNLDIKNQDNINIIF